MNIRRNKYLYCIVLAILIFGLTVQIAVKRYQKMISTDVLSEGYSKNVNSLYEQATIMQFTNNQLYYVSKTFGGIQIKGMEPNANNIPIHLNKVTNNGDVFDYSFCVLDNILIFSCDNKLWMMHLSQSPTYICRGTVLGKDYLESKVYFQYDGALYSYCVCTNQIEQLFTFDKLYYAYEEGIIYSAEDNIYAFLYATTERNYISKINNKLKWGENAHIFFDDQVIILDGYNVRLYSISTQSETVIFHTEQFHKMALCANQKNMFISLSAVDESYWPVRDVGFNGTWQYDFSTNAWTKLSSKTFRQLVQCNNEYLFGVTEWGGIRKIKLNG